MIKGEHLHDEINGIKKTADEFEGGLVQIKPGVFEGALLKAATLMLKLLLNIRQNQTKIMEFQGIKLITPKGRNAEETSK